MSPAPVLVIGATGKTGRRIVRKLEALGLPVRAGSRQATPRRFDWHDPAGWPAALEGVRSVYVAFHPDLAVPGAVEAIDTLCMEAEKAGVEHLVLLSGRGEAHAQRCEELVRRSGIDFTILRAAWFAQNFDEGHLIGSVRAGILALPAGRVREPFVDLEDIADVAVAALTDPKHRGELYELTGPRLLDFDEVAAMLTAAAGHAVRYQPVSFEEHERELALQAGPEFASMLTNLMREILDGRNAKLADGVQRALGRAPRDFREYTAEVGETGVWNRA